MRSLQAEPCRCPEPNPECMRAGQPMIGQLWEYCSGNCGSCQPFTSNNMRYQWDVRAAAIAAGMLPSRAPDLQVSPCVHLGNPTGQTVECPTCSGSVKLKLFHCLALGSCTTTKKVEGVACCVGCSEYQPAPSAQPINPKE